MQFYEMAKARYSVRHFDGRHVKKSKLNAILEAGRIAPTAKNYQPQKIYVLESDQAIEKINSVCKCIYGASTVLLVCYDKNIVWKNPFDESLNSGETDCAIVLTHMMLEAQNQGVNSVWVKFFDPEAVKKAFELPDNLVVADIMPLGYGCEDALPSENHSSVRKADETIIKI